MRASLANTHGRHRPGLPPRTLNTFYSESSFLVRTTLTSHLSCCVLYIVELCVQTDSCFICGTAPDEILDLEKIDSSDIIKGFMEVKSKGKDLKDYIDPENGFLYRLKNHEIIDEKEIKDLENITPYQSLNERLIIAIEKKIESHNKQFIKALCEDEQDHIAKFIVTAGCETDSDERLLPREIRKVINDNMFCLKVLIDTERQDLLMKLVAANCIREIHRDKVMNFKPDEERAYQLLIIIQRRRFKDFFNFMSASGRQCRKI